MPFGSRFGRVGQWWQERSSLEKILIIVTIIAIVLIIVLLARPHHRAHLEEIACITSTCIKEAAFVLEHVDHKINPCENFHNFSCARLENQEEEEVFSAGELGEQIQLELYKEPIQDGEHKMVKSVKKLFQACMNEEQRERDELNVMKEVLKAVGGWPVLEGPNWNEANFDWLNATYKLRELGHEYQIFLDFTLWHEEKNGSEAMLMVSSPATAESNYGVFKLNQVALMQEIAIMFGAKDIYKLLGELDTAHTFSQNLAKYYHPFYIHFDNKEAYKKYTIEEYQKHFQSVNWLELLNNIVGPATQLTKNDTVLFPPPANLTGWFDFISKTPKRTQANYMMWRLIEVTIPYLTKQLRATNYSFRRHRVLEEVCMETSEISYSTNPITIMANRRYIPVEKKKILEEMIQMVKNELVDTINKIKWIEKIDKQALIENLKSIETMIAEPPNYLDDKILDDMDVDMVETEKDDFLSLLAQFKRNLEAINFRRIRTPKVRSDQWFVTDDGQPMFIDSLNTLFIPAVITKKSWLNEKRPNYLNYGSMGYIIGYHFVSAVYELTKTNISAKTKQTILEKIQCVENVLDDHESKHDETTIIKLMYQIIGEEISYSAYEKWLKKSGPELNLLSVTYTQKQLFWISLASTVCNTSKGTSAANILSLSSLAGNKHFLNDFGCTANPKINPIAKCDLL